MIDLDFSFSNIKKELLIKYQDKVNKILSTNLPKDTDYTGWINYPNTINKELIEDIIKTAEKLRKISSVLVVCGIGGSYLGSSAVYEALRSQHDELNRNVIWVGNNLSEKYLNSILKFLDDKDYSINVISKSGQTLETALIFRIFKEHLEKKYPFDSNSRIIVTTDENSGLLINLSRKENLKTYFIPKNIGGRYSVFTPVGLFPLSYAGIDIRQFLEGAKKAVEELDDKLIENNISYQYAIYRYINYINKKKIELLCTYEPSYYKIQEWWKQLFAESEGKDGKGLFPGSILYSTDLHSLGQFIQDGNKIIFETVLDFKGEGQIKINKLENDFDGLNYLSSLNLKDVNDAIVLGTASAHYKYGNVNNLVMKVYQGEEYGLGYLMYFFMKSCMMSGYLLGINPFNQPGVEVYKREVYEILNIIAKNQKNKK